MTLLSCWKDGLLLGVGAFAAVSGSLAKVASMHTST